MKNQHNTKVIFTLLPKLSWNNFFLNYWPNFFHCSPSDLGDGGYDPWVSIRGIYSAAISYPTQ